MTPQTPEELAEALGCAAARGSSIALRGNSTKEKMAGPTAAAETEISTTRLNRVLQYEPRDLTISVEAGIPYAELSRILRENRQMLPLDPPYAGAATIGGILGANTSGPRRRLYGTARDLVIGMKFATLEGKLVQSGGMVVKNVAGLDMAKLLIGSFGTLAAMAIVNFKLVPLPEHSRTLLLGFDTLEDAAAELQSVLAGVLQPAAIDLLNAPAAARIGHSGVVLLLRVGGSSAVVDRYSRELPRALPLDGAVEEELWQHVQEFTPEYLAAYPEGAVVRVSATLSLVRSVIAEAPGPALARAGSGVVYVYFDNWRDAAAWVGQAAERGWKAVIEFAPPEARRELVLWPRPGNDLELMRRIKALFDPNGLLNRGRLYGVI